MTNIKSKYIGILGTLLVHTIIIALLILVTFSITKPEEESGITIMAGDVKAAYGGFDPQTLVEVTALPQQPQPQQQAAAPPAQETAKQDVITQNEEEAPAIPASPKNKKKAPDKKDPPQKTAKEISKQKQEDARKLAQKQEEARKAAATEAAAKRVAGAFGKGAQQGSKGTAPTGAGTEGSPTGNAPTGAISNKTGGYGTFDLNGRSIGPEGLPRPGYSIQEEGKVVVTITVNPAGKVVNTSINRQTNTVNPVLRKAAEAAAKGAIFNAVDGVNNQTGTITYYFNLK